MQVVDDKHALMLVLDDLSLIIVDLRSMFGTYVDGERVPTLEYLCIRGTAQISFGAEITGTILDKDVRILIFDFLVYLLNTFSIDH